MQVIKDRRVLFSIGKIYKSDVLSDVKNMDVCHLLFGRL